MDWYISREGIGEGPFSETEVNALLREGRLTSNHLAWSFGRACWTPIGKISGLQGSSSAHAAGALRSDVAGASETDSAAPGVCPPAFSSASYCARHWRGALSLPVSFWINGSATSLALVALVTAIASTNAAAEMPRLFSAAGVAYWLFLVVLTIWQLVGIWRSASKYVCQSRSKCWGRLAQAMVAMGIFTSIFTLAIAGVPQTVEFAQLAVGSDPIGKYELRLSADAREIAVSGAIVFGLTDDVARALEAKPAVKIIHLNSQGGRVGEARRLRDFIAARKLTTVTASGCFSACTIAYAAGERRLIGKNASLGFHQYAFPGVHDSAFRRQYERDKGDWLARGFDPAFIERAYSTPPDDLWQPGHRELFASRFVTGYALNSDSAIAEVGMNNVNIDGSAR